MNRLLIVARLREGAHEDAEARLALHVGLDRPIGAAVRARMHAGAARCFHVGPYPPRGRTRWAMQ